MDAFYASVEQHDRPELRGKAVLVAGSPERRGVVSAASYEARPYGCRSAMPTSQALRRCPHAIVVPVRMRRYQEVSRQVFTIFEEFSPVIEPLSVDEAFLDLTGTEGIHGSGPEAARKIKRRIREVTGLTASVGVAPNKFLAKLASDLRKPDGLCVVEADQIQATLDPLPVERLWGVGAATLKRFAALGVRTVGDVRRYPLSALVREFGSAGEHFHRLAHGEDARSVQPDRQAKSISHEVTFAEDTGDLDYLRTVLIHQVEDVAYRLRRHELEARTVSLKLRDPDFNTITRSATLPRPTQSTEVLWELAESLFEVWARERHGPLRLLGMGAGNLSEPGDRQLSLFAETDERRERLDRTLDSLRERFGPDAVRRRAPGGEH